MTRTTKTTSRDQIRAEMLAFKAQMWTPSQDVKVAAPKPAARKAAPALNSAVAFEMDSETARRWALVAAAK